MPVDLADTDLAKPALTTAIEMARASGGSIRLVNVLAMTPVMLAEYVPPDFDVQQRTSAEEALGIIARECGLDAAHVSSTVRQGGIYHEVLEEAKTFNADLIVMSSHRPAMRHIFSRLQCRTCRALRQVFGLSLAESSKVDKIMTTASLL